MDLELDADQATLRDQARAVLQAHCPPSFVRDCFEGRADGGNLWRTLADQGWSGVTVPVRFGGLGQDAVTEAVLAAEVGRAVAPVPYLATVTLFGALLAEAAATATEVEVDGMREAIAAGTATGTVALAEAGGCRPENVHTTATPEGSDGAWRIDGAKVAVPDAPQATFLAVTARLDGSAGVDGLGAFLVDPTDATVTVVPHDTIDPTWPLATVTLEGARVAAEAVLLDPHDLASGFAVERVRRHATVMDAMSCVASCRVLFESTVEYAKTREQFGRPIGSFQALKHRLADAYLAVERADALCWYAVTTVTEGNDDAPVAVAMAKAAAGECRRLLTRDALQLHGGIGFTWEHDLHLWLKRATAAAFVFGDVEAQRAELAGLLGLGRVHAGAAPTGVAPTGAAL